MFRPSECRVYRDSTEQDFRSWPMPATCSGTTSDGGVDLTSGKCNQAGTCHVTSKVILGLLQQEIESDYAHSRHYAGRQ